MTDTRTQTYKAFLQSPQDTHLSGNARVTYVTSGQAFDGPDAIISNAILNARHLKKSEKITSTHIGSDSIVLETVTTIEFVNGTGSYVTGLDKNFVVNNTVVLPIIHVVILDGDKIKSVRLYWDQGTMLKQLNIIGSRGNVWPIVSGSAQEKLVISDAVPSTNPVPVVEKSESFSPRKHFDISQLEPEVAVALPRRASIAPAVPCKPQPRSFQDMIDSQDGPIPPSPRRQGKAPETHNIFNEKNQQPLPVRAMKGPARSSQNVSTPDQVRAQRFNAKNFEPHFKFGTPDQKPSPYSKTRANMHPQPDEPKWDYDAEKGVDESHVPGNGRRDMVTNFELNDASPAPAQRFNGIKIAGNGMGSRGKAQWSLNMNADDDGTVQPKPVGNVRKDLISSFQLTDSSPSQKEDQSGHFNGIKVAGNGMGGRGKPQWSWDTADDDQEVKSEAPTTTSSSTKPAPLEPQTNTGNIRKDLASNVSFSGSAQTQKHAQDGRFNGIKIAGNGMGGRGKPQWSWDMRTEEEEPANRSISVPQKQVESSAPKYQGRLASHRQFVSSWSFGNDESDKEN
ncbi:hypothetical protein POJ06DRAFT_260455 [Lipomyces tetrasporus]|uniref:Uncharacterized protein n=1 Tax=Lipomyces tetrasporus TaxID=54092 RepID=A0AAD7VQ74_9ASCO|nr:uncharacterized protein POJ06DRAFT_260455 [Lipomyces tetrasporus]KAJ8097913.1 hypothetical protein POJ06DRAFT_260455 [Lipomyces tetrasporus]